MVGTIVPIVHGERDSGALPLSGWIHLAGTTLSGAMAGATLGVLGGAINPLSGTTLIPVLGFLSAAYGAHELRLVSLPMPQFRRQVPRTWSLLPPRMTALLYGLGLGWGFGTFITSSAFHVVALWSFLSGEAAVGAMLLGTYGFFRGAPILLLSAVPDPEKVYGLHARITGATPLVKLLGGLVMSGLGAAVLAGAI